MQCGWGLVCQWYDGDADFPCTGTAPAGERYCVQAASSRTTNGNGNDGANGAEVLSVTIVSSSGTKEIDVSGGQNTVPVQAAEAIAAATEADSDNSSSTKFTLVVAAAAVASSVLVAGLF